MTEDPSIQHEAAGADPTSDEQIVWTYRGYRLRPAEFNAAMVHLYRGEVSRANTWRQRLDRTTNWAVVVTATAISFALSGADHHHAVLIISTLLVTMFLFIEARRYRYYDLWSYRIRLMEQDYFANMLVPPFAPSAEWAESLAESLLQPDFGISMLEAFGRRLRYNYFWIYIVLGMSWLLKALIHPTTATSLAELLRRGAVGPIPGWAVLLAGLVYNGALFALGFLTAGMHRATGEVLPKYGEFPILSQLARTIAADSESEPARAAPEAARQGILRRRRRQLLALVITNHDKRIADRVLADLKRGATSIRGTGMYTGNEHRLLMVATTVTEIPQLRAVVRDADAEAFVIVVPAQQVIGQGFEDFPERVRKRAGRAG